MDTSLFISKLLESFWWFIPLLIVITIFKSSWFKGLIGELIVNISAKFMLDKNQYHLIKNVTLPTQDGTTQIDHIIVSVFGVFVIETKNMKGWIFGSKNQKIWTQKIYKHSSKFQNPLHQNYKHIKTLESLLELNENQIYSLIVFVGNSRFKTEMPENVTYSSGYIKYIKSKTEKKLSKSEVKKIITQINTGRLNPSLKTNRTHIQNIKQTITNKEKNNPACPKCGSSMVLRESKKEANKRKKFWGCKNYPKCRGTLSINN